jgi:serine/threonine protein kinase
METIFEASNFCDGYYKERFSELKKIGKGSFGSVFEVEDKNTNDRFAVKKIIMEMNQEIKTLFTNFSLIRDLTRAKNKYIVEHYESWFENRNNSDVTLYIRMELCDKSLEDILNEITNDPIMMDGQTLTPIGYYISTQIFIGIIESVDYLHKLNPPIIHRNLKPANILFKSDLFHGYLIKITDFGKMTTQKSSSQSHTLGEATDEFMAPEVMNNKKYDTKADIYSLGIILQELLRFKINELNNKFFLLDKFLTKSF